MAGPKKILLATRPLVPPWDEASKNFAYFLGRSVKNHFLTLLGGPEKFGGMPETVTQAPVFPSGKFDALAKLKLFFFLRKARNDFDATHYLFTPTLFNTQMIRFFARPTRGQTIQNIATIRTDLYSVEKLRTLFFADRLIVNTERSKGLLEALGFSHVTRIYPGIDLELYQPRPKDAALMKRYGFTGSDFLILYPGEYTRLGATDFLVNSLLTLYRKSPGTNIKFFFACRIKNSADKKKKEAIKKIFAQQNLLDRVIFEDDYPFHGGMHLVYNLADVVVFPALDLKGKFDVPLTIIEAYACAKPVILSDLAGFAEFSNEKICVTIPRGSEEKFLNSVAYLRQNKEIGQNIGRSARHFVEEHFNLKRTAEEYERIYESI